MSKQGPIFILGIMQRSGTNWLRDLLLCHPDCYPATIQEDFLLANSQLLVRFGSSLYRSWPESWRADERVGPQERLHRLLGEALLAFIGQEPGGQDSDGSPPGPATRRLVTKTPSIDNLDHCFNFFPDSQLLILVRDGRTVVESGVRSFNWDYENAIRRWDGAARKILSFRAGGELARLRSTVVKYEDLFSTPDPELRRLLGFLNLDPAKFDFDRALGLPVRGSSVFGRPEQDRVRWRRLERTEEFAPLERAADWDRWKHERFNRLAGESLEALGYQKHAPGGTPVLAAPRRWFEGAKWSAAQKLVSAGFLLRRAMGRSDPDFMDGRSWYYVRERRPYARPKQAEARSEGGPK
jgi:Sulfotransferase family